MCAYPFYTAEPLFFLFITYTDAYAGIAVENIIRFFLCIIHYMDSQSDPMPQSIISFLNFELILPVRRMCFCSLIW